MLQYQKIDVSEGIDVNKTGPSKECELCKNLDLNLKNIFLVDVMIF